MKRYFLTSVISLLVVTIGLKAQTLSGAFMVGVPQKDFKEQNDNTGFGLQIQGTLQTPGITSPITLGASIGFLVFSSDERTYNTSAGFFDFEQTLDVSSNMANFHLFVQLAPIPGPVKPYAELLGGGNLLFTTAKVDLESVDNVPMFDDKVSKDDSFTDFTWSYGAGAGIQISIVPLPVVDLYIDLKARYLRGGEAEFVTEEDVEVDFDEGTVYFSPRKAKIELLSFHVGVSVHF
jgi:hypothetical protein